MSHLRLFGCFTLFIFSSSGYAQLTPIVTHWLQNDSITGKYYVEDNFTPIDNGILANCQEVSYSPNWVYIRTNGIPTYTTGPFLDGNPSQAIDQNRIIKLPRHPEEDTLENSPTIPGNIGMFINGVALFDFRDGVAWNPSTQTLCGGPNHPPCPGGQGAVMPWNRNAIVVGINGFDCSKGQPEFGNYHHQQNPTPYSSDLVVISDICDLYGADGLYNIDSTLHSPLIGFAYDGFPIYGSFGFKNTDGTGGIARMKSSYQLRNITIRNTSPTGANVGLGPAVSTTYPLGYFREDYEFVAHPNDPDFLDEHNGRYCITPDYPNGTYAYFATIDENWNSAYPYVIGPTFYGMVKGTTVASINEPTVIYVGTASNEEVMIQTDKIDVFPNPANDFLQVRYKGLLEQNLVIKVRDMQGRIVAQNNLYAGQTSVFVELKSLDSGTYFVEVLQNDIAVSRRKILVTH